MTERFEIKEAVRENVPLLLSMSGASGGGKTVSALRLAHGIQDVVGGDIVVIDTDNGRALSYSGVKMPGAERPFKFKHIRFNPPYGSRDYIAALEAARAIKPGVIIVDQGSSEHEGEGGHLEAHEKEVDRMAGTDWTKREAVNVLAWAKPKADRRKLIQYIQRLDVHTIFCFRAKMGVKPIKTNGRTEFVQQGFMPIAGDELVFEMTLNALLLPNSGGVAKWNSEFMGERMMTKLPEQFIRLRERTTPIDEELGRQFAKWAEGGVQRAQKDAEEPAPKVTPDKALIEATVAKEAEKVPPQPAKAAAAQEPPVDAASSALDDGTATAAGTPGSGDPTAMNSAATDTSTAAEEDAEVPSYLARLAGVAEGSARPTETASASSAEAGQGTSDSATDASVGSAAATPGTTGETLPSDPQTSSAIPEEFTAFAFTCADAKTWEPIRTALPVLKRTEAFKAAAVEMQDRMHVIAFTRLMELIHEGYRFDFTEDLHAYRCYLAWEQEIEPLKAHRQLTHKSRAWQELPTDAKILFDKAYDTAVARIEGATAYA